MKQRFILFVSTLVLSIIFGNSASAYDVEVDGIYYNLIEKGKIAEVTYKNEEFCSYSGDIVIPKSINYNGNEYIIKIIGDYSFSKSKELESVTIPDSVTIIDESAFYDCQNLSSVIVGKSVNEIRSSAFKGCKKLISISLPQSVSSIGNQAFEYSGLTSIIIPDNVSEINEFAFYGCKSLSSVILGNSIKIINREAFANCESLESIIFNNSLNIIKDNCFAKCSNLKSINLPNSVNTIGESVFYGCSNLSSISMPNSIVKIGSCAFMGCSELTNINLPKNISEISYQTFADCSNLKSIIIPNSVKIISYSAFEGCEKLVSISIGKSVEKIRNLAFSECKNVSDVYCYAEAVPITEDNNAFYNSFIEYATLHVPANSIEKYKSTKPWSDFGTIKAITEEETKQCATPVISYSNGELILSCETEGAKCTYNIKSPDVTYDGTFSQKMKLPLYAYYNIYCEATAEGYTKSDLAEATLYWLPAEGTLETNINTAETRGVMASSANGFVTLSGLNTDEQVSFYTADGRELGFVKAIDGMAHFAAQSGTVVIAKIGKESLKIAVK